MKPPLSRVYLEVAELIDRGVNDYQFEYDRAEGVCDVLDNEFLPYSPRRRDAKRHFMQMFVTGQGYLLMHDVMPLQEAQKVRVLALLFMHHMALNDERTKRRAKRGKGH